VTHAQLKIKKLLPETVKLAPNRMHVFLYQKLSNTGYSRPIKPHNLGHVRRCKYL